MGVTRRRIEAPDGIGHYDEVTITDLDSTPLDKAQVDALTGTLDRLFGAWGYEAMVSGAEAYWRAQPDDGDLTPLSRGWYRDHILQRIAWVRKIVQRGIPPARIEEAIVYALDLGAMITAAEWRFGFNKAINTGRKVRVNAKAAAQRQGVRVRTQARQLEAEIKARADAYKRKHPGASERQIARDLARETRKKPETVRSVLRRLKHAGN
jgi:hypothetical protein